MRTLVVQSHTAGARDTWIGQCLESVERWAEYRGFDYRFYGDEALGRTPHWYRNKLGTRTPIVADLVRLLLIQEALAGDYEQACWLDGDVLLFAPDRLSLSFAQSCAFGREYWVDTEGRGRMKVRRNVHNAICAFKAGCPVLPFLIHATERIIRRADPERIAPQMVGPKLIGALHNIVGFDLIEAVGAFSPTVIDELQHVPGEAVATLLRETPVPLAGANLCASLQGDRDLGDLCARLVSSADLGGGCAAIA